MSIHGVVWSEETRVDRVLHRVGRKPRRPLPKPRRGGGAPRARPRDRPAPRLAGLRGGAVGSTAAPLAQRGGAGGDAALAARPLAKAHRHRGADGPRPPREVGASRDRSRPAALRRSRVARRRALPAPSAPARARLRAGAARGVGPAGGAPRAAADGTGAAPGSTYGGAGERAPAGPAAAAGRPRRERCRGGGDRREAPALAPGWRSARCAAGVCALDSRAMTVRRLAHALPLAAALAAIAGCKERAKEPAAAPSAPAADLDTSDSKKLLAAVDRMAGQLKDKPKSFEVLAALGNLYYENGRYLEAVDAFRQALELSAKVEAEADALRAKGVKPARELPLECRRSGPAYGRAQIAEQARKLAASDPAAALRCDDEALGQGTAARAPPRKAQ